MQSVGRLAHLLTLVAVVPLLRGRRLRRPWRPSPRQAADAEADGGGGVADDTAATAAAGSVTSATADTVFGAGAGALRRGAHRPHRAPLDPRAASVGLASAAAVAASTATASADDDGVAVSQWLEASLE